MSNLPTKPIEKIFIEVRRDPSVGISNSGFEAEVFIDLGTISWYDEESKSEYLELFRGRFKDLYSDIEGDEWKVSVLFDFEVEAIAENEARMADMEEKIKQDNCSHDYCVMGDDRRMFCSKCGLIQLDSYGDEVYFEGYLDQ